MLECTYFGMCTCVLGHDSPGNAEHHHTDDDHLECSNDGGDEDIVQFTGAWYHVEHIVLFDITLGTPKTRVTAEAKHTHAQNEEKERERDRLIISVFQTETSVPAWYTLWWNNARLLCLFR